MSLKYKEPVLSICVPTFNRATVLKYLLPNVSKIINAFPSEVELCFSDNCSNDETDYLLQDFKRLHHNNIIKILRQEKNIGLSNNVVAVCSLASGKWIWVVGDDDGFIFNDFSRVMDLLKNLKESPWIIVNSISGHNDFSKLNTHQYPITYLSNIAAKFFLLRSGTVKLGFIGVHIIPRVAIKIFSHINPKEFYMWPHIMVMNRFISENNGMLLLDCRPVIQSLSGQGALFWAAKDFFKIEAQKALISKYSLSHKPHAYFYNCGMFIRQIYSAHSLAYLISWKIKERADFKIQFRVFLKEYISGMNIFFIAFLMPLIVISLILQRLSNKILFFFLPKSIIFKIQQLHLKEDSLSADKNGISRIL